MIYGASCWGANGIVYNFVTDEFGPAKPEDRLLRTTEQPLRDWTAPEDLKKAIKNFSELLKEFFLKGGQTLDIAPNGDSEACAGNGVLNMVSEGGARRESSAVDCVTYSTASTTTPNRT